MREKGFILPLVLVAIALGIIVVGEIGYSKLKSKSLQKTQTAQDVSSDQTNWRFYTNSDFKFQISYPKDWNLKENEIETGGLLGPEIKEIKLPTFSSPNREDVSVEVRVTILEEESLDEIITESEKQYIVNKTAIMFQGLPAIKYEVKGATESLKSGLPLSYTTLIFKKENVLFEIISFYPLAAREDSLNVFNQMLSTFKFID